MFRLFSHLNQRKEACWKDSSWMSIITALKVYFITLQSVYYNIAIAANFVQPYCKQTLIERAIKILLINYRFNILSFWICVSVGSYFPKHIGYIFSIVSNMPFKINIHFLYGFNILKFGYVYIVQQPDQ